MAVLAYEAVNLLDVTGPVQVFATAGEQAQRVGVTEAPAYEVVVFSPAGGLITTSCGIELNTRSAEDVAAQRIDTLLVAGGVGRDQIAANPDIQRWLRWERNRVRRLGSCCTGAFILAAAGLLDTRRASTHWIFAQDLRRAYPAVRVEQDVLFTEDHGVWTSAGVTAGIDMALAMVEQDFGKAIALETARRLILHQKRSGGQSPVSAQLDVQGAEDAKACELAAWILQSPQQDLRPEVLAQRAHLSLRSLFRLFRTHFDTTPGDFVERVRLDAARRLLEQTDTRIERVAQQAGFGSTKALRQAFRRRYQVSPLDYRQMLSRSSGAFDDRPAPERGAQP